MSTLNVGQILRQNSFRRRYPFATQNQSVSSAASTNLTSPATVTVNFPTGATYLSAKVTAVLKANNQTTSEHNIAVTLQENIAGGGWATLRALANEPLTMPSFRYSSDAVVLSEATSAIADTNTVTFRWVIDSDDAGEVHYTSTFMLEVQYDFST